MLKKIIFAVVGVAFSIILMGFLIPEPRIIPVVDAKARDWHPETFWYEPWGRSRVHKGMDIFAKNGQPIVATTNLIILHKGFVGIGGKIIIALGPKWRLHYFAHLSAIEPNLKTFVKAGEKIGKVGNTGNARGKQAHLHYSIMSMLPMPWRIDTSTQGYLKALYLDPTRYLES